MIKEEKSLSLTTQLGDDFKKKALFFCGLRAMAFGQEGVPVKEKPLKGYIFRGKSSIKNASALFAIVLGCELYGLKKRKKSYDRIDIDCRYWGSVLFPKIYADKPVRAVKKMQSLCDYVQDDMRLCSDGDTLNIISELEASSDVVTIRLSQKFLRLLSDDKKCKSYDVTNIMSFLSAHKDKQRNKSDLSLRLLLLLSSYDCRKVNISTILDVLLPKWKEERKFKDIVITPLLNAVSETETYTGYSLKSERKTIDKDMIKRDMCYLYNPKKKDLAKKYSKKTAV